MVASGQVDQNPTSLLNILTKYVIYFKKSSKTIYIWKKIRIRSSSRIELGNRIKCKKIVLYLIKGPKHWKSFTKKIIFNACTQPFDEVNALKSFFMLNKVLNVASHRNKNEF